MSQKGKISREMTHAKRFSPKILHKGLALVLTPIIFESVFFYQLAQLVTSAEQLAQAEARQSTIVEHANSLISMFVNATGSVATYIITGNQTYAAMASQSRNDVNREFDELNALIGNDPRMTALTSELKSMWDEEFKKVEAITPAVTGADIAQTFARMHEIRPFIKRAGIKTKVMNRILAQQRQYLTQVRDREVASREKVKEAVFWGIIGNFILAVVLVLVFLRDITGRLAVLVENARRLPRGEELVNHVSGSDELYMLDNVLHDAAREIKQAQADRQSIIEMVAHDLRSPLMSSQVALELLGKDTQTTLGISSQRHVETVKRNITRLVSLVNDLLTVEKLEAGKLDLELENLDIQNLVEEALQSVSGLANQKQIVLKNAGHNQTIVADRARLIQVLVNYLANAIKFSPQNSTVTVFSSKQNGLIKIAVRDEGPGMSQEEQERLFSKFYQTRQGKRAKGFGLGLAICKLVVESHGGNVGVDSEPERGAEFWFTLPA